MDVLFDYVQLVLPKLLPFSNLKLLLKKLWRQLFFLSQFYLINQPVFVNIVTEYLHLFQSRFLRNIDGVLLNFVWHRLEIDRAGKIESRGEIASCKRWVILHVRLYGKLLGLPLLHLTHCIPCVLNWLRRRQLKFGKSFLEVSIRYSLLCDHVREFVEFLIYVELFLECVIWCGQIRSACPPQLL